MKQKIGRVIKVFAYTLCIILLVCLTFLIVFYCVSCEEKYDNPDKYDEMFNYYDLSGDTVFSERKQTNNFSSQSYYSYLAAFPRKKPQYISEFNFYSMSDIGVFYAYFVYHLDENEFNKFETKMSNYKIEYNGQINTPIYDTEHFKYPTYVLTWMIDLESIEYVDEAGVAEYIMLDKENKNVINVFKVRENFEKVQKISSYDVFPSTFSISDIVPNEEANYSIHGTKNRGFSIYSFKDADGNQYIPDYDELKSQFLK